MIGKAEQALAALEKQQADEAEKQRQEEERINTLKLKYTGIIAEADQAFKNEKTTVRPNYAIPKPINLTWAKIIPVNASERSSKSSILRNTKPDWPNTIKTKHWPKRIWNRKTMLLPRYISEDELTLSPADKESIRERIAETDRLIEAEQLAAFRQSLSDQYR